MGAAALLASLQHRSSPQHVVVIGGSLAGLLAAAAAVGDRRTITVLERDTIPGLPVSRPGVPQGDHPHVYLYRGLLAVEELLPGLRTELLELGAVPFDTGDLPWLAEPGWLRTGERAFELLSATRPLFESVVRRRVAALPGVTLRSACRVAGLRRAGAGWEVRLADGTTLPADLVVDASGRTSRLPGWLAQAGIAAAPVSEVDARVGYATRRYARTAATAGIVGVVLQQTPSTRAGGVAFPVEGGHWQVAAIGCAEHRPPRDAAGFAEFLGGLRDPALAELVGAAEPVGDVVVHRQTGNLRHHYERVRGWPDGLLVLGDALCAFNPIYGQGVSVAAAEALLLRQAFRAGLRPGYARRLQRRFARVVSLPWSIAAGDDLRYPTSSGSQSMAQAALGRWTRQLTRLAVTGNRDAQAALSRVYHLMGSPALLFHPAFFIAAARARLAGSDPAVPRPRSLDALSRLAASPRRVTSPASGAAAGHCPG